MFSSVSVNSVTFACCNLFMLWLCFALKMSPLMMWRSFIRSTLSVVFLDNICKTVRHMLSVRCLSVLSVCNVGVLWPNSWMHQDKICRGGKPRPRPHCVRWAWPITSCGKGPWDYSQQTYGDCRPFCLVA